MASAVSCAPWWVLQILGRPLLSAPAQGIETEKTVQFQDGDVIEKVCGEAHHAEDVSEGNGGDDT